MLEKMEKRMLNMMGDVDEVKSAMKNQEMEIKTYEKRIEEMAAGSSKYLPSNDLEKEHQELPNEDESGKMTEDEIKEYFKRNW
jgi:hypothetical protein